MIENLDRLADGNLLINCVAKTDRSQEMLIYLQTLSKLDNTVSVGIGNYDNAAILAARLINDPEANEKMWQYRNGKTQSGVLDTPEFLENGRLGGK